MRIRTALAACVAAIGLGYAASPYVALYRLGAAAQRGDVGALAAAVDWDAVREGLKEDICDAVFDEPAPRVQAASAQVAQGAAQATALPPFGASFFAGIAGKAVDDTVTPDGIVGMLRRRTAAGGGTIGWSFFDGASSFTARLYAAGDAPILLHLRLRGGQWQVVRAELPARMLSGMQTHT